jgi:hypothetical protein
VLRGIDTLRGVDTTRGEDTIRGDDTMRGAEMLREDPDHARAPLLPPLNERAETLWPPRPPPPPGLASAVLTITAVERRKRAAMRALDFNTTGSPATSPTRASLRWRGIAAAARCAAAAADQIFG